MAKIGAEQCCSIYKTAEILDGKWTLLIFRDLLAGPARFNALRKSVGSISPKTLSDRLRFLEEAGVLSRTVFPEIPPRVEYELTEKGRALAPVFDAMKSYGEQWL